MEVEHSRCADDANAPKEAACRYGASYAYDDEDEIAQPFACESVCAETVGDVPKEARDNQLQRVNQDKKENARNVSPLMP
jgi:hypothetical protein